MATEFLQKTVSRAAACLVFERAATGTERTRSARELAKDSDGTAGHESGCGRLSHQTLSEQDLLGFPIENRRKGNVHACLKVWKRTRRY
jgi:hypothetical protein